MRDKLPCRQGSQRASKCCATECGGDQAFTLIELLVVASIIAILASLLLPVLSRGKAQAQSASCRNHLRQMAFAMKMYLNDSGKYPFASYESHTGIKASEWVDLLQPYYPLNWTNRGYHCPSYTGLIDEVNFWGSYGYNGFGTWEWGQWPGRNLGLGGASVDQIYRPEAISEAQVLNPCEMIEFGEPLVQKSFGTNSLRSTSADVMFPNPVSGYIRSMYQYPMRHGKNTNLAFSDSHVESLNAARIYEVTNSATRWNNDNLPHPETWNWY
jgi:prepilin-type N-terminal cleavage/methylation domain-containing protein/prepilin-type processing-associated H-X9-DG protein